MHNPTKYSYYKKQKQKTSELFQYDILITKS